MLTKRMTRNQVIMKKTFHFRSDKKMDRLLSGIGDGCDSCVAPRSLWHDLEAIKEGFPMNRSFESVQHIWDKHRKDKHGEIKKSNADFEERQGVCHEPKRVRPTVSFTVTHKVKIIIFPPASCLNQYRPLFFLNDRFSSKFNYLKNV